MDCSTGGDGAKTGIQCVHRAPGRFSEQGEQKLLITKYCHCLCVVPAALESLGHHTSNDVH